MHRYIDRERESVVVDMSVPDSNKDSSNGDLTVFFDVGDSFRDFGAKTGFGGRVSRT